MAKDNQGGKAVARRYSRSLTAAARDGVPPEILISYCIAIMEGHGSAVWKRDDRFACGWTVVWSEGSGAASTPQQMEWAWTQLRQAGWGMPIQSHIVEAEFTASQASQPIANLDGLSPAQIIAAARHLEALDAVMRRAQLAEVPRPTTRARTPELASTHDSTADTDNAIDAEFTEAPASSSSSDD